MKNLTRTSLSISGFAVLALIFGACSQPEVATKPESMPNAASATEIVRDSSTDTEATGEEIADLNVPDSSLTDSSPAGSSVTDSSVTDASVTGSSGAGLQAQGTDNIAPKLHRFYPTAGMAYANNYPYILLEFSEKMKHDSIKNALKLIVKQPNGKSYNIKGTFWWYDNAYNSVTKRESVYFYANKPYPADSVVTWKLSRDAKDLAGNRLIAGKSSNYRLTY
jgi:Bacterial Ig-like domain